MANPGGNLNPFLDTVSVTYDLIDFNTLQPVSHSGKMHISIGWFIAALLGIDWE